MINFQSNTEHTKSECN